MKKLFKTATFMALIAIIAALSVFFVACDKKSNGTLRFAAPDGTPALAMLRLASQNQRIGNYDVDYEVTSPENIAGEMGNQKADIVIMPINAGAQQIVKTNGAVGYKLVSVAVEGSLYLVGHKDAVGNETPKITINDIKGKRIACIGQTGVPGKVFQFVMRQNGITLVEDATKTLGANEVYVEYAADGSAAATRYYGNQVDYIVVGEPAATAQKLKQDSTINAEMDMQAEYGKVCGLQGVDEYPQAGLFVKTSLANNSEFMRSLFAALDVNEDWIEHNPSSVTAEAQKIGSASVFPAPSIARCALDCSDLDLDDGTEIVRFLSNIMPNIDWASNKDLLFEYNLAG